MSLAELFSIIAVVISFIAVCISFLTFIDNKRQTKIMQKQLDEQLKPKFTDEPYNAYTAKLDRISRNLNDISKFIIFLTFSIKNNHSICNILPLSYSLFHNADTHYLIHFHTLNRNCPLPRNLFHNVHTSLPLTSFHLR